MADVIDIINPVHKPSWQRWPPNCCETCVGPWIPSDGSEWVGKCGNSKSLNYGEDTDARFRCQDFTRRST